MLKLIWGGLLFEILILLMINPFVVDFEFVSILAVLLHALFTMIVILSIKNKMKIIFLGAFFARFFLMLWDNYASHIYILPNSGADSTGFFNSAISISRNITLLSENIYGGIYVKIVGFLFYVIGPLQSFGYYINVLLGLSIVFIIFKILMMLKIEFSVIRTIILMAAFFPNSLLLSAVFLREMFIALFVVASLYFFVKWFKSGKGLDMLFSMIMLGVASMFHSGVIGISVGYAFIFLFYKKGKDKFSFNLQTVFIFLFIAIVSSVVFTQYQNIFLKKFDAVEKIDDIYSTANSRLGESTYLTGVTIDDPVKLIVYGPIKAFYFLTAPLPMNWRGFIDMFTFFSDSLLYLGIIFCFLKNRKTIKNRKTLVVGLTVMLISVSLIFGIGVGNAGTAVRHRHKFISLFLVLLSLIIDEKKRLIMRSRNIRRNSA